MVVQADTAQAIRDAGRSLMLSNYIMDTYSKMATPKQVFLSIVNSTLDW